MASQGRLGLWLALCAFVVPGAFGEEPVARPKAKVEFRWLEEMPVPGVTEVKGIHVSEGDDLSYPHQKPILTNADVVEVRVAKLDFHNAPQFMIYFHLTEEARQRLAETCGKSGEKSLVSSIDGVPRGAPYYLKSRDKSSFAPYAGGISKTEMERIVEAFKKAEPPAQRKP